MLLVTPENIASVMDLDVVPHSFSELDHLVAEGLPKKALKASVERICSTLEEKKRLSYQIVPEATYKRRRTKLTAEESGRAECLARVLRWRNMSGTPTMLRGRFCTRPIRCWKINRPSKVSLTEIGARRVEELLWKLFYGIAA